MIWLILLSSSAVIHANPWKRIECWSCDKGGHVRGNNFGPEECQKYGKMVTCNPGEICAAEIRFEQPDFEGNFKSIREWRGCKQRKGMIKMFSESKIPIFD
ncbi:Oidioi.mRNA.OKI2018_I69.chr2.g6820.t1.cds [Oikopleura dioica]|uniref:Oidioi.mRNA.OKI2018_I69.chr2.g6820.t1.cds n=1 Tax=Oikopleura dioica TaxID=34765 RepID=A0ABN7T580_OIKDI|nr:Oidioi.mRNA.OKI2018_I69.chr2.g6820.t1.cds [Oikopleura dioica]